MTQIVQPESDAFIDDWDNQSYEGVDLFASLRITPLEDDPDPPTAFVDDTFIVSETMPIADVYVTKLEEFVNPEDLGESWVLKFRAQKMNNTGTNLDLTVQLREGYVSEAEQGNLLFEQIFVNVAFGFQDYEMEMTVPDPVVPNGGDLDPPSISTDELYVRVIADIA